MVVVMDTDGRFVVKTTSRSFVGKLCRDYWLTMYAHIKCCMGGDENE